MRCGGFERWKGHKRSERVCRTDGDCECGGAAPLSTLCVRLARHGMAWREELGF